MTGSQECRLYSAIAVAASFLADGLDRFSLATFALVWAIAALLCVRQERRARHTLQRLRRSAIADLSGPLSDIKHT